MSWCVKRQEKYLGIATSVTPSAFDCSLVNPEGST
jgi:hypothetical protein